MVSEGYAELLPITERRFDSSQAFHRAARGRPGNVTGGMLKGLRVRNFGAKGAVVEFAGKSMGSRIKARKKGGSNQRVKVANRKKAQALYWRLRVNPIQPTDREVQALSNSTALVLGSSIATGWDAKPGTTKIVETYHVQRISDDIRRGVPVRMGW